MKKLSTSCLKISSGILTFLLTLFGLTTCIGGLYACPSADYDISGCVVDEDNNPIPGIEVSLDIEERTHDTVSGTYSFVQVKTDSEGKYHIKENSFPVSPIIVSAKDVDGEANGLFQNESTPIDLTFKGAEKNGWYRGKATAKVDFQLKNDTTTTEQE